MDAIADILLIAGATGAGVYCFVLARRLRRFTDLEKGVGGAIAVLSVQVDDMTRALGAAQASATTTSGTLDALTDRAEDAARRLELLVAAMHDLPVDSTRANVAPQAEVSPVESPLTGKAPARSDDSPPPPSATFFLSQRARIRDGA
jgi:hypothetical protein